MNKEGLIRGLGIFVYLPAQIPSIVVGVFLLFYLLMEYLYTSWSDLGKVMYFSIWIVVVWLGWTIFNSLKVFKVYRGITGLGQQNLACMDDDEYNVLRKKIIDKLIKEKSAGSHIDEA